jgi:DNA-binding CsgD family transcriptional regulator/lambda repressor-like predicted transcriptional regulator
MTLLEEIAAKYGCVVAPDAKVQVVPPGVSGHPGYIWREGKLELREPIDWRARQKASTARAMKARGTKRLRILAAYDNGASVEQIAADHDWAPATVRSTLRQMGRDIPFAIHPHVLQRDARLQRAIYLTAQGWNSREIAADLKLTPDWLSKIAREGGLKLIRAPMPKKARLPEPPKAIAAPKPPKVQAVKVPKPKREPKPRPERVRAAPADPKHLALRQDVLAAWKEGLGRSGIATRLGITNGMTDGHLKHLKAAGLLVRDIPEMEDRQRERQAELKRIMDAGWPGFREAAKQMGVGVSTLAKDVADMGLVLPKVPRLKLAQPGRHERVNAAVDQVATFKRAGVSMEDAARETGFSIATIKAFWGMVA